MHLKEIEIPNSKKTRDLAVNKIIIWAVLANRWVILIISMDIPWVELPHQVMEASSNLAFLIQE